MKYAYLSLSLLLSCQLAFGQIVSVNIIPPPNHITNSFQLNVKASVIPGEYELASVIATVENTSNNLTYRAQSGYYEGPVSLTGLTVGNTYVVSVTATDILNNQLTDTMQFIIDPLPTTAIQLPVRNEVASPLLHIKANKNDNSDCNLVVRVSLEDNANSNYDWQVYKDTFVNVVDTIIELSDSRYQGLRGRISFTVTDSRGQSITVSRRIFVETSPYLEKVFSTEGLIVDFNHGKVLSYFDPLSDGNQNGKITDVITGNVSEIPALISEYSYLTPSGAMFAITTNYPDTIKEWKNDTMYLMGTGIIDRSLKVAGPYAIWSGGFGGKELYLRNTATGSTKLISTNAANGDNDVAANGTIAYWAPNGASGYDVYRYANDTSRNITNNGLSQYPLTDGNKIVYLRNNAIYMHQGTTNTLLSNSAGSGFDHYSDWRITNGFIAYAKPGLSGQKQVWLRDTAGVNTQITFFSNSSTLEAVGTDGSVSFSRNSKRHLYERNANGFKAISSAAGKTFYRDSAWYVSIGRVLFKLKSNFINSYYSVQNGNWSNPATWYGNAVPPAGADVTVGNNIIVDIDATCNTLTLKSNAAVTVNEGINLVVLH